MRFEKIRGGKTRLAATILVWVIPEKTINIQGGKSILNTLSPQVRD